MSNEVDLRKQRKVDAAVNISSTGLATEAKQDSQIALATLLNGYVDGLESLLTTLNGKDFATETTLNQIKGYVDGIETLLTDIELNTTGLNLEATQLLIKTAIDFIKANTDNLDVALSTRLSKADFEARINTLGQKTSANSTPVVLPSDQIVSVTSTDNNATTQTTTTVAATATSTLLKAANSNRKQISITNTSSKRLWICFFTPATSSTPFFLDRDETWVFPTWKGDIYGIWDTAPSGNAYITEETP